ncbi:MAG UNVERIFIED_CONTAM: hypothetical protein LVT10_25525 [Anaerolineae bacterium]|jgi:hypothetical protein
MTVNVPLELILVWATIRRRWWLMMLPLVVLLAVMAAQGAFAPAALRQNASGYTTVVRFSAAQALDAIPNRDGDFQDVWLSSELTVKALITWARTSSFAREVAFRAQAQRNLTIDPQLLGIAADHQRKRGAIVHLSGTIQTNWSRSPNPLCSSYKTKAKTTSRNLATNRRASPC